MKSSSSGSARVTSGNSWPRLPRVRAQPPRRDQPARSSARARRPAAPGPRRMPRREAGADVLRHQPMPPPTGTATSSAATGSAQQPAAPQPAVPRLARRRRSTADRGQRTRSPPPGSDVAASSRGEHLAGAAYVVGHRLQQRLDRRRTAPCRAVARRRRSRPPRRRARGRRGPARRPRRGGRGRRRTSGLVPTLIAAGYRLAGVEPGAASPRRRRRPGRPCRAAIGTLAVG